MAGRLGIDGSRVSCRADGDMQRTESGSLRPLGKLVSLILLMFGTKGSTIGMEVAF